MSSTPTVADLVAVKPLEWKGPDLEGDYMADHPFGWYETYHLDTCILLSKDGVDSGTFETLDAAKAAAEADYKARILSRLSPADLHDATAKQRDELAAVKPLEWEDFEGRGAIARAGRCESYLIDRWPDGRFGISFSAPGYSTDFDGKRFHPTLEAAKVAAQADFERRIFAHLSPAATEPVAIPRYPTQEMMDAGLYHLSEDVTHDDLFTAWTAMFDAVALDGGTSDSLLPSPVTVEAAAEVLLVALARAGAAVVA